MTSGGAIAIVSPSAHHDAPLEDFKILEPRTVALRLHLTAPIKP